MPDQPSHRLPRNILPQHYRIELVPDLARAAFTGTVAIDLRVEAPSDAIVLNAADLEIHKATVVGVDGSEAEAEVDLDVAAERATITPPAAVAPGPWTLRLEFAGLLNDKLRGFYRSTYRADDGTTKALATTQFEAADARRAFPCWDEPEFKATFEVTLVVDAGLTAISNSAVVEEESIDGGRRRVRFAPTIKMSTYLVAFVVGEFELTEARQVQGVPLRIAAPPGRHELTAFATDAAEHALTFLSGYFDIPYPADKIDHIAIPDFAFGAMENVGCVTYRETALGGGEQRASQLDLQRVAQVVAHETAHMWFGNLVTMRWWNGIWLNEAFATFMELTTVDAWRPGWDVWTAFGAGKAAAMGTDGLRSTRPVEFEVEAPEDADAMFDVLTYQKGGSVLRMLEQYLGADVFRAGISRYLTHHSFANTETTDLWDAIEAASGEPVRAIMDSWIFQGGYPLVTVAAGEDGRSLHVAQRRFLYDGSASDELWSVPLSLRISIGGRVEHRRVLLDDAETTITLDGPVDWVMANEGARGFYRTRYSADLLSALRPVLPHTVALERIGILHDTWAGVLAGAIPLATWVGILDVLDGESDPDVWAAALQPLALLDLTATADPAARRALQHLVRRVCGPALERLGWDAQPGESERVGITRGRLISALGTTGADPGVRTEAARRFAADSAGSEELPPDLRVPIINVVAAAGGMAEWEALRDRYEHASNPQDKVRYLYALAYASDPEVLDRTLDLCLSDAVRNQDAPFLVAMVLANPAGASRAWDWVTSHWDAILSRYPANLLIRLLEGVTALVDSAAARSADQWLEEGKIPVGGPRIAQVRERLAINVAFAGRVSGNLAAVLGS